MSVSIYTDMNFISEYCFGGGADRRDLLKDMYISRRVLSTYKLLVSVFSLQPQG